MIKNMTILIQFIRVHLTPLLNQYNINPLSQLAPHQHNWHWWACLLLRQGCYCPSASRLLSPPRQTCALRQTVNPAPQHTAGESFCHFVNEGHWGWVTQYKYLYWIYVHKKVQQWKSMYVKYLSNLFKGKKLMKIFQEDSSACVNNRWTLD